MDGLRQTTIAREGALEGVALHTGAPVRMFLRPAPAGAGIVFRRADLVAEGEIPESAARVPARADLVADARLGVTLRNAAGVSARTVEHLMAALALCEVDNVLADLEGPELPILDGSAAPFIDLIGRCGLTTLPAPRRFIEATRTLRETDAERFVEISPARGRRIEVSIDFADPAIGRQSASLSLDDAETARRRLGPARTFCALREVDVMRAAGLARGGSLDNAVVVDGARVLNAEGLRDPAEFVLHKALDLVGDLALAGAPVRGRIVAHKPGHDLNTRLARRILEQFAPDRPSAAPARLTA
ncbi:UDP-3-O-acyl-N-acetylglucosamine deacetylase [Amphiplicatus metriothermophilus]|uniref:UDP-3-O-acyl-N-acetylglucosamine deacetylase n=1 Tax=Amphiplicatus metriothermophilus TaxID=1519374 RepID=A0A239PT45_9PROT|nr:UDP-3-O-acyl-N-acetylglucosamine deacetylase [Amphiplicatus metriothermophilus]MBB5519261.1 UDP-3-O-[3-hydroxymyristoyl] N-acetylglucosamine deacetylase [Amphiplicatus metriothermophilus]SNT73330.1 UDP-3-O-[3-hydroxymyristoyl] N-acetylglucosamine deacetylase [Amphiplicatus metriothermophilus]